MGELGLELQVAVPALLRERPVRERRLDRAARLALVAAVGEAAVLEEGRHVVERLLERLVGDPELELAHSRRVDHERAARQLDELAADRRVPALAVAAELLRLEQLVARERVDERRLADPRGAEKRGGDARSEVRANRVEALARDARERVDGDVGGDRPDGGEGGLRIAREVALRQQHHRLGAALARQDEVALEAAQAQVLVERRDDEDDVDVRGEHLLLGRLPRGLAREPRAAREQRLDRPRVLLGAGGDGDPVTDGGEIGGGAGLLVEPSRDVAAEHAGLGEHVVGAAVLHGDAARDQAVVGVGLELLGEAVVPAEGREVWHGEGSPLGLAESGRVPARPSREARL